MSLGRNVTGPRRTVPSVEYAIRTSRSPASVSSTSNTDEKRRAPARCGTVTCSTSAAAPHGVFVFATSPTLDGKPSRVGHGFVPKLCQPQRKPTGAAATGSGLTGRPGRGSGSL